MHRFDTGGLENGVVNLINRFPRSARHAVALTEVTIPAPHRARRRALWPRQTAGPGLWYPRMRRVLRELRPSIVHTRNLAALEMSAPAAWAGIPVRIHGEHGWDISDPEGVSRKHRLVRRLYRPFVHQYIALSRQLQRYLLDHVGVAPRRLCGSTTASMPSDSTRRPANESLLLDHRFVPPTCGLSAASAGCTQ